MVLSLVCAAVILPFWLDVWEARTDWLVEYEFAVRAQLALGAVLVLTGVAVFRRRELEPERAAGVAVAARDVRRDAVGVRRGRGLAVA